MIEQLLAGLALRAMPELAPSISEIKRADADAKFQEHYGDKIAECREFNKTVNTRQVRRHYARVMAKRGGAE